MDSNRITYSIPFWENQSGIFICRIIMKCSQNCMRNLVLFRQITTCNFYNWVYSNVTAKMIEYNYQMKAKQKGFEYNYESKLQIISET